MYRQPVNVDTGMRLGKAVEITPNIQSFSALSNNTGYASWGLGIGEEKEPLFIYMAPIKEFHPQGQRGIISLGVPVKVYTNFLSNMDLSGGYVFSAIEDGHFLIQTGPPNTSIAFGNNTLTVQLKKIIDDVPTTTTILLPCKPNSSDSSNTLLIASDVNIWGTRYEFYSTSLEIAGLRSVCHKSMLLHFFFDVIIVE